jgi:geranylgeranyl diphosphate synthase type I
VRTDSLTLLRDRVDATLSAFLAAQRDALDAGGHALLDEIERLLSAGGKRLRPTFCFWGHIAAGGEDGVEIVRASAALELLHTFAIVHDDVIDRSPLRRGAPSTHRTLGDAAAILTGDLALVLADRLLATSGFAPAQLAHATERYDRMRMEAVSGEYLDVKASATDESAALRIAALKSGGYTVAHPLAIGAILAGNDGVLGALEAYGRPLGVAFQLRDDVLGVFGDPSRTGKDRDGDLREGKRTVLVAKARAMTTEPDRAFLDAELGRPDVDAERVRAVLRDSGALDATLALIDELAGDAKAALDPDAIARPAVAPLMELADLVAARDD